jgi:hypothetical protein
MTNDEKKLIDGLIEEMDRIGADFSSTQIEFHQNGKIYCAVLGVRLIGEERVQQND